MASRTALILTGLIQDRQNMIPVIEKIISKLATHGHEIDVYCHQWNEDNRFLFEPFDKSIINSLPIEQTDNVTLLNNTLSPHSLIVNNFSDMKKEFEYYLKYALDFTRDYDSISKYDISYNTYNLPNKNFDNPSISEKINLLTLANSWRIFVNKFSQMYSFIEVCKEIERSNKDYDNVLRWRYDVFTNHRNISNISNMLNNKINGVRFNGAWLQFNSIKTKTDIQNIPFINTDAHNKVVYLEDLWWAFDYRYIKKFTAPAFSYSYIEKIIDIMNIYNLTKQPPHMNSHAIMWKTLVNDKTPINVCNEPKINSFIIRDPSTMTIEHVDGDFTPVYKKFYVEKVKSLYE